MSTHECSRVVPRHTVRARASPSSRRRSACRPLQRCSSSVAILRTRCNVLVARCVLCVVAGPLPVAHCMPLTRSPRHAACVGCDRIAALRPPPAVHPARVRVQSRDEDRVRARRREQVLDRSRQAQEGRAVIPRDVHALVHPLMRTCGLQHTIKRATRNRRQKLSTDCDEREAAPRHHVSICTTRRKHANVPRGILRHRV